MNLNSLHCFNRGRLNHSMKMFQVLPDEIIIKILNYVNGGDIISLSKTCRNLKRITEDINLIKYVIIFYLQCAIFLNLKFFSFC